eukprot:8074666-Pyramimonas_sp.AAC.1
MHCWHSRTLSCEFRPSHAQRTVPAGTPRVEQSAHYCHYHCPTQLFQIGQWSDNNIRAHSLIDSIWGVECTLAVIGTGGP